MNATRALPQVEVSADGEGIVSRAGLRLVAEVAEHLGLTEGVGAAMAPTRQRRSAHYPGKVLVDIALTLADGGRSLSDLAVVRNNPEPFGPVASDPTAWRVVDSVDNQRPEAIAAAQRRSPGVGRSPTAVAL